MVGGWELLPKRSIDRSRVVQSTIMRGRRPQWLNADALPLSELIPAAALHVEEDGGRKGGSGLLFKQIKIDRQPGLMALGPPRVNFVLAIAEVRHGLSLARGRTGF